MNEHTPIEKINTWIKNSVMLKLITISILMLVLLIPAAMIESIIEEREQLNNHVTEEVSAKWAKSQTINGPILTIPLVYHEEKDGDLIEVVKNYYILPESLQLTGNVDPKKLKRGIYEVVVYDSKLHLSGKFNFEKNIDRTDLKEIRYEQAFLTIGISDLKGLKDQITINWNDEAMEVEPGSKIPRLISSGVTIDLPLESDITEASFAFDLNLQGSQHMSFIPLGKMTEVNIESSWPSPSFDGTFLPDSRTIRDDGFQATWKVLQLNRNFPQQWTEGVTKSNLLDASFGVGLVLPLDDYQKAMRSAKYAVMTIALTFLIFFLVEILNKKKIHPFQYILVGLALCLFYILLVSISEHLQFNIAYGISAISIVSMITLYASTVFKRKNLTIMLVAVLCGIYGFLFITLQLADYALLMGSIGLSIILALTMYFTRNINWYSLNIETE